MLELFTLDFITFLGGQLSKKFKFVDENKSEMQANLSMYCRKKRYLDFSKTQSKNDII